MSIYEVLIDIKENNQDYLQKPFLLCSIVLDKCSSTLEDRYFAKCFQYVILVTNVFEMLKNKPRRIAINLLKFKDSRIKMSEQDYLFIIETCIKVIYDDYQISFIPSSKSLNNGVSVANKIININSACGDVEIIIDDNYEEIICYKDDVKIPLNEVQNTINIRGENSDIKVVLPRGKYCLNLNVSSGNIDIFNESSDHIDNIDIENTSGNLYIRGKVNNMRIVSRSGNVLGVIIPLVTSSIDIRTYSGNITLNLNKVPYSYSKSSNACYLHLISYSGKKLIFE